MLAHEQHEEDKCTTHDLRAKYGDFAHGCCIDFIETHYVGLKASNPKFPILIRECSGVQPRLYARYDFGKESSISLANLKAEDVLKQVERLSKSY